MLGTLDFVPPVVQVSQLPARARAVLVLLAVQALQPVSRARIAETVWPRRGPEQARQSLRQALAAIRAALPRKSGLALITDSASGTLRLAGVSTDLAELEAMSANPALASTEAVRALWRGPFLSEFPAISDAFEEWLTSERSRVDALACDILAGLCTRQLDAGIPEQAIQTARDFLRLDPMREDAHRLLMQAYAAAGRSSEAVQHYEECTRLLQAELGVAPDAATQALMRTIRASIPAARNASPSGQATTFVPGTASPAMQPMPLVSPGAMPAPEVAPRRRVWPLLGVAVLVLVAGAAAFRMAQPRTATVDLRPRYVVSSFAVQSSGETGKALAAALTTRLSNGIAGIPNVRLVVPATSGAVTAEMADYRVEGAVIPGDQATEVQAWVVDLKTGQPFGRSSYKAPPGEGAETQTLILGRVGDDLAVAINRQIYLPPDTTPEHKRARQMAQEARQRIDRKSTDLHATLDLFRQAMRLSPDDIEVASWFANALVAEGSNGRTSERDRDALFREADELIGVTLKKAPYHRLALYARCQLQRLMNQPHAAYAACQESNRVLPWSARIHKEYGFIQLSLGALDAALDNFAAADSLEKRYSVRWIWKYGAGLALMLSGQNAQARDILREAISLHEDSANSHLVLAVVCNRLGASDCVSASLSQFRAQARQLHVPRVLDVILPAASPYSADIAEKVQSFKAEALKLLGDAS